MQDIFEKYITEIQQAYLSKEAKEHSYRTYLENLLNEVKLSKEISLIHEGKREGKFGIPDFKIKKTENIIGYIETKDIGTDLDKVLQSEQIKKYISLSDNLILTDYLEFIWIKEGETLSREKLINLNAPFSSGEGQGLGLNSPFFFGRELNSSGVLQLLQNFFSTPPKGIANTQKLAEVLALRAKLLKEILYKYFENKGKNEPDNRLFGLYETFKEFVFDELGIEEFADALAQMLVYGLFLAKLNADTQKVTIYNLKQFIHTNFQLIRELVGFLDTLDNQEYKEVHWVIEEILTIMNTIDLPSISNELSFNRNSPFSSGEGQRLGLNTPPSLERAELGQTDPYIYFYEDFLAAYDAKMRKARGVYYTPPPIVNFIVRAINEVLQTTFGIEKGLAEGKKVTILDFATGTGTFLLEILEQILEIEPNKAKRELLIKEHILKNIYGFEYLIAPYTIAHLKLSQFLKEQGYHFAHNDRLQIFLTNTLEQISKQIRIPILPALTAEANEAQRIKEQPILVICGNPPYSGYSKNNGKWITDLVNTYKFVDGKDLKERNSKAIQNDYVKFIRFAQWKMEKVEAGIVGVITSNSFLDGVVHRGMRQSLMQAFDQIYILDLHGNSDKKEKSPDGSKDENIFDITEGVSISIFVKKKGLKKQIFHTDYFGLRKYKYEQILKDSLTTIDWEELKPNSPFYLFVPQNQTFRKEYDSFWSVKDIFSQTNNGLVTHKDDVLIQFKEQVLLKKVKQHYPQINIDKNKVKKIHYRPFDYRFIYYDASIVERARVEMMKNMLMENTAIVLARNFTANDYCYVFCSDSMIEKKICSHDRSSNIFPLYLYEKSQGFFTLDENNPDYQRELKKLNRIFKTYTDNYEEQKLFFEKNRESEEFKIIFESSTKIYQKCSIEHHKQVAELRQKYTAESQQNGDYHKIENFTSTFRHFIDQKYRKRLSAEQIIGYIYAILHSPTYREKYKEFLKSDFPKIPWTESLQDFEHLSNLGNALIEAHLLKNEKLKADLLRGEGNNLVEKANYNEKENCLYFNVNQYFERVSKEVYHFQIGGYQVIDKYLKDRKGQDLSADFEQVERIIKVLEFTIRQMQVIDEHTKDWV
ncbi:MAG: N-6 DNA methylase [Thermoflexibacter sp.]|nr:N-6 DNA methylase [Thermoflexibacter sp.]